MCNRETPSATRVFWNPPCLGPCNQHWGDSKNQGPSYVPQNSRALIIRTTKNGPPNFWKPPFRILMFAWSLRPHGRHWMVCHISTVWSLNLSSSNGHPDLHAMKVRPSVRTRTWSGDQRYAQRHGACRVPLQRSTEELLPQARPAGWVPSTYEIMEPSISRTHTPPTPNKFRNTLNLALFCPYLKVGVFGWG